MKRVFVRPKKSAFEFVSSSTSSSSVKEDIVISEQPTDEKKKSDRNVFKLNDINLEIPRGQLCAIVGPVGSGKSSLIQAMIGGKWFNRI